MPTSGGDFSVGPHSADLELTFRSGTLKELFAAAARSTLDYVVPGPARGRRATRVVDLEAAGREELLVAWLNEVLYYLEVEGVKYDRYRFRLFGRRRLKAEISGAGLDFARRAVGPAIKAATYHDLRLVRTAAGWEAKVVFDL